MVNSEQSEAKQVGQLPWGGSLTTGGGAALSYAHFRYYRLCGRNVNRKKGLKAKG
jgi:hypothetical protein